jgi:membrane-bound transcription factor site-1 protease
MPAAPRCRTAALILLVLCDVAHAAAALKDDAYSDVYIVQLRSYAPLAAHEGGVRALLHPLRPEGVSWAFVLRANPAAARYPTDFVLARVGRDAEGVLAALRAAAGFVRSVTPQAEHGRALRALLPRRQTQDFEERGVDGDGVPRPRVAPRLQAFGAGELWKHGAYGQGVRVAVFDTGITTSTRYFGNVVERTDWTEDRTVHDRVGHGTFVAGLIGGSHPRCPGIAPGAELLTFRVFAGAQVSYTSWFLDAFNYALQVGVDVLNLSIGGPDFADEPFTDKVNELTAAGIVVVSAIGNDGPLWGSLNNPGDMMEVVGVGGVEPDGTIASFSSRGMTMQEMASTHVSYGRVKPDLVAYGRALYGPSHSDEGSCKRLSGTSVASPVVAGAIALVASTVPLSRRRAVVNPASVKRALLQSSRGLAGSSIYEQGSGLLDIAGAARVMKTIDDEYLASVAARLQPTESEVDARVPRSQSGKPVALQSLVQQEAVPGPSAVLFPSHVDLTSAGCPLLWPHCSQPLFAGGAMLSLNITILNPGGVSGAVDAVNWIPARGGSKLVVHVSMPGRFWPWAAGLGVHLSVDSQHTPSAGVEEVAEGYLRVRVKSIFENTYSEVELPIRARIAAPPLREKRLLWDMYHSLRYPPGYVPRDSVAEPKDMLDWLGDHPHTNYHAFYRHLRLEGYYVDVLDSPLTCLSDEVARSYGTLLLVDSEDYFGPDEIERVKTLVQDIGLGLVVASDWYNTGVMKSFRFEDDNTRSWWMPVSAGANVPSLNALLRPHGIALGNLVVSGLVQVHGSVFHFESGNGIVELPAGSEALVAHDMVINNQNDGRDNPAPDPARKGIPDLVDLPVLGMTRSGAGAVAVYGDTNCIDTAYKGDVCYNMFVSIIEHIAKQRPLSQDLRLLFPESSILPQGLRPRNTEAGRIASTPQSRFVELLRPHSRTLSRAKQGGGTLQFKDTVPICASRFSRLIRAPLLLNDSRLNAAVVFPEIRYAEPLRSTSNYYSPHFARNGGPFWSVLLALLPRLQTVFPSHLENLYPPLSVSVSNERLRSPVVSMMLGLFLIFLSVTARFFSAARNYALYRKKSQEDRPQGPTCYAPSTRSSTTTFSFSSTASSAKSFASLKHLRRWP